MKKDKKLCVVRTVAELRSRVAKARAANQVISLVPTMGALHRGHFALIKHAKMHSQFCIVSIFINPTQFGPAEDYATYPRCASDDIESAISTGASIIFAPTVDEMYPAGQSTIVQIPELGHMLEGRSRPGFFFRCCDDCCKTLNSKFA